MTCLAVWFFCSTLTLSGHTGDDTALKDPFFGEALFYAHQGKYFNALERMDTELIQHYGVDEPQLDSLYFYVGRAEFSVGDFELNYRMHRRAGRAITAVLEGNVEDEVRNEAAFRLARIQFQKGQLDDALHALERINGRTPPKLRDDVEFLRANVYLAMGQPDKSTEILKNLQNAPDLEGYSAYNLGVALWRAGEEQQALSQLDRAGQIKSDDLPTKAIKDKANLVMGTLLLDSGAYNEAMEPLERVRLEGPFSNQALLKSGWADMSSEQYARAVVPWNILAQRDSTNAAVQEAKLALPYAYSRLQVHSRAAVLYGQALESFSTELEKLDASIASIRDGRFLEALVREEVHHDKDWVVNLRKLPQAPETFYLTELLASHDFQNALQNYLDLEQLRTRLKSWSSSFSAYQDIIEARLAYYQPLLPEVDNQFRELDSRMRVRFQQQELLTRRLQDLLVMPRPEMLATTEERLANQQLAILRNQLDGRTDDEAAALRQRLDRVQGAITWRLRTEYHERLTLFNQHLEEAKTATEKLREDYQAYVRVRQAASHSYEGYESPFKRLQTRVDTALETLGLLMARQGHMLEQVAVAELERRQKRLDTYQDQARYAMADSYDRATKALQARGQ